MLPESRTTSDNNSNLIEFSKNALRACKSDLFENCSQFFTLLVAAVNEPEPEPAPSSADEPGSSIFIFSAFDPDSLCAVQIIQNVFDRYPRIRLELHVVASYRELRRMFLLETRINESAFFSSPAFVFINMGSRCNLLNLLDVPNLKSSHQNWNPTFFIVDIHRPIALSYVKNGLARYLDEHFQSNEETEDEESSIKQSTSISVKIFCSDEYYDELASATASLTDSGSLNDFVEDHLTKLESGEGRTEYHSDDLTSKHVSVEDMTVSGLFSYFFNDTDESETPFGHFYSSHCAAHLLLHGACHMGFENGQTILYAAIGASFHFLNYSMSRIDYDATMKSLARYLEQLRKRQWRQSMRVLVADYAFAELKLPLLRFGKSIESAVRFSPLTLLNVNRNSTKRDADIELKQLRVDLQAPPRIWSLPFCQVPNSLKVRLPPVLLRHFYHSENINISKITIQTLLVRLQESSLPDRITAIDLGFMLATFLTSTTECPKDKYIRFTNGLTIIKWICEGGAKLRFDVVRTLFPPNRHSGLVSGSFGTRTAAQDSRVSNNNTGLSQISDSGSGGSVGAVIKALAAHTKSLDILMYHTVERLLVKRRIDFRKSGVVTKQRFNDIGGVANVLEGHIEEVQHPSMMTPFVMRRIMGMLSECIRETQEAEASLRQSNDGTQDIKPDPLLVYVCVPTFRRKTTTSDKENDDKENRSSSLSSSTTSSGSESEAVAILGFKRDASKNGPNNLGEAIQHVLKAGNINTPNSKLSSSKGQSGLRECLSWRQFGDESFNCCIDDSGNNNVAGTKRRILRCLFPPSACQEFAARQKDLDEAENLQEGNAPPNGGNENGGDDQEEENNDDKEQDDNNNDGSLTERRSNGESEDIDDDQRQNRENESDDDDENSIGTNKKRNLIQFERQKRSNPGTPSSITPENEMQAKKRRITRAVWDDEI